MFNIMLDPNSDPEKFERLFRVFVAEPTLRVSELETGLYYKVGSVRSAAEARDLCFRAFTPNEHVLLAGTDLATASALGAELTRLGARSTRIPAKPQYSGLSGKVIATYCQPRAGSVGDFCDRHETTLVFIYDTEIRLSCSLPKIAKVIATDSKVPGAVPLAQAKASELGGVGVESFDEHERARTHRLLLVLGHDLNILPYSVGEYGTTRDHNFIRYRSTESALTEALARLSEHKTRGGVSEVHYLVTPEFTDLLKTVMDLASSFPDGAVNFIETDLAKIDLVDGDEIVQIHPAGGTSVALEHVRVVNDQRIFFELFPNGFVIGGLGSE